MPSISTINSYYGVEMVDDEMVDHDGRRDGGIRCLMNELSFMDLIFPYLTLLSQGEK